MARPDPIQYAERLYAAIRAANFSPISFLAFGNAIKDGVPMRQMPRLAAEPFMRIVGTMLDFDGHDGPIAGQAIAGAESSNPAPDIVIDADTTRERDREADESVAAPVIHQPGRKRARDK
ncbi:MAG TPA: hypothetical protein VKT78_00590 [Fimbriimonadaceae bacterium]|nr:hypothetical protein [Fimbriimonadaceae bacterium]